MFLSTLLRNCLIILLFFLLYGCTAKSERLSQLDSQTLANTWLTTSSPNSRNNILKSLESRNDVEGLTLCLQNALDVHKSVESRPVPRFLVTPKDVILIINALGRLKDPASIDAIKKASMVNDDEVYLAILDALKGMEGVKKCDIAIDYLKYLKADIQLNALDVLQDCPGNVYSEPIRSALFSESEQVRWKATHILGNAGDTNSVGKMSLLLSDTNKSVRQAAEHNLKKLGVDDNTLEQWKNKASDISIDQVYSTQLAYQRAITDKDELQKELNEHSRLKGELVNEAPSSKSTEMVVAETTRTDNNFKQEVVDQARDGDVYKQLAKSLQGTYHALIIGNNDYAHIPKLITPHNDAITIDHILRNQYGFNTELLLDATRTQLLRAISRLQTKLNPQDNVLIYYAGHGYFDEDTNSAYWLPVDAEKDDDIHWIRSERLTAKLKKFPSNHVLIVADSCYSGTLTRGIEISEIHRNSRIRYLEKMIKIPSRTLLASGGNEPVADGGGQGHSIFAQMFIDGLLNTEESVFTAEEFYIHQIKENVSGNAEQTPEYHRIKNSGHTGGDFVFSKIE